MIFYPLIVPQQKKLINNQQRNISVFPDNAVIGNAARGDVVDDEAMIEALKSKKFLLLV